MSANTKTTPKIEYDGSLTIATGKTKKDMQWKNRELLWSELLSKLSETTRTRETHAEYMKLSKAQQDGIKDVGGFVGGTLKGGRRKAESVVWRQVVTLDADFIKGNLWDSVEMMCDFGCAIYSTHKHTPEKPRLRLVFPLSRGVTPDEYQAISRRIAADIGIDFFDDTTYQAHRLMYWPSTSDDGEFVFHYQDEPWLDPDEVLNRYLDWTDPVEWPESSRQQEVRKKQAEKQGDPQEKPGMVGAFCRTYSIDEAIDTFLSEVYEPAGDGRYTYVNGSTTGGLVLYDDLFAYSHHGTDPIGGQLVNAFDLVRIHKFGARDEDAKTGTPINRLPSTLAMSEFSGKDEAVRLQLGRENLQEASELFDDDYEAPDNDDWLKLLQRNTKSGKLLATRDNLLTILENDPHLSGAIKFNAFDMQPEILKRVPWETSGRDWSDGDESALMLYIEKIYDIDSPTKVRDALEVLFTKRRFHPVCDYLDSLEWDGTKRLDTLFIDYLGAEDNEYVRAATRKTFAAAVKRVKEPGCKFDFMPVLVGSQGIGKSYLLTRMGRKWFSDSLTTVHGKEAYEQLHGVWIMEMGEMTATKKAEVEAIKMFLSKQTDKYRVAYGRRATNFPRQCVFFGTTNDREFLRDKTGNRRFWPINVGGEKKQSPWKDLTDEVIGQIWAEAVACYEGGEKLYLEAGAEDLAREAQIAHTEGSALEGLIQEYLDLPLPDDWEERDISERRNYIHGSDFGDGEKTGSPRTRVCAMEIWVEAFSGDPKQLQPIKAREINDILRNMPGWHSYEKSRGRLRFGSVYGLQKAFIKDDSDDPSNGQNLDDLLVDI